MDTSTYQPAAHVLDRLAQVNFVAVVGPTAVGKSTLIKAAMALDPTIHLVLNNTSRAPRPGERDGIDYQFRNRQFMEERIVRREYVQVAPKVLSELYATAPEGYATDGVSVMAVLAEAMPQFRQLPFRSVGSVFILPPSWEVWQQRLKQHGFTPEQQQKRLAEAVQSLNFALNDQQTTLIINDDLKTASSSFIDAVHARHFVALNSQQVTARQVAAKLLEQLQLQ